MISGFGRAAVSTALDFIKVRRAYVRKRARTIAGAATATFFTIEAVGNLIPTTISLVATRAVPSHEALLTQALLTTFAAILVEHLVTITLLWLAHNQAPAEIAKEIGHRNLPPPADHYLPPLSK
jgi:hypothetical protein